MAQLFIRWICLIFDAIPYTWPFTGLVGFIVILCSRNRQRIGDHAARTLVISTRYDLMRSPQMTGGPGAQMGQGGQPGQGSMDQGAPGDVR